MGQIKVHKNIGEIEGLCIIETTVHGDNRGYFMETYSKRDMEEAGINIVFVQDNQSCSTKGVLRGLHYQQNYPQTKLIRVLKGIIYDVVVDLRKNSSTFGKWYGLTLTNDNKQLFVPQHFAHGFLVLSETAEIVYKCDDYYHPEDEYGIIWNDPTLNIVWNVSSKIETSTNKPYYIMNDGTIITLSNKDNNLPYLKDIF